jgi:hypothetical protein
VPDFAGRRKNNMQLVAATLVLLMTIAMMSACSDDGTSYGAADGALPSDGLETPVPASDQAIPADLVAIVDNPFFPLRPARTKVYEGQETGPETDEVVALRVEETVLEETNTIAGVEVRVLEVREYENGELVEMTRDYHAQSSDGTVYYLGEHVDDYEDGAVVGHSGQWIAGEDGALPGVFMPADPGVGDQFEQERAPGVAEDQSEVVETGVEVTATAGTFTGCIKTEDYDPIGGQREFKYYCPEVGLVREESAGGDTVLELVSY